MRLVLGQYRLAPLLYYFFGFSFFFVSVHAKKRMHDLKSEGIVFTFEKPSLLFPLVLPFILFFLSLGLLSFYSCSLTNLWDWYLMSSQE